MKLLKLIPDQTHIPFTKFRWPALALTSASFILALVATIATAFGPGADLASGFSTTVALAEVEAPEPHRDRRSRP
mgnify:CR=1 FL=1